MEAENLILNCNVQLSQALYVDVIGIRGLFTVCVT